GLRRPSCSGNESLCSSNVHTEVLPYTLQHQLNVFLARDTCLASEPPKQSNQNALRNRMEELGSSICPPNIVVRPPNAHFFNYQISWIPCGFLLPLRGRRSFSPANSCVSDV